VNRIVAVTVVVAWMTMSWISAPLLASSEAFVCSVSEHGDGYVVRAMFHCVTLFDPLLVYDRQLALVGYSRGAPMNADSWGLIPLIILFALPCNKSPGFDQGNIIPGRPSSNLQCTISATVCVVSEMCPRWLRLVGSTLLLWI
jgi:hypothetical protein